MGEANEPESRFLLCTSRVVMTESAHDVFERLIGRDLDWDRVISMAIRHHVLPLLHKHVRELGCERVPNEVIETLRHLALANAAHNAQLTAEAVRIIQLLRSDGLDTVLVKGPALALDAYGSLDLRQFGDLDFLIHRKDAQSVEDELLANGYIRPDDPEPTHFGHSYDHPNGTIAEMHWGLAPSHFPFRIDPEGMWDRLGHVPFGDIQLSNLAAEDLMVILPPHASRHYWNRLLWVCDIAELCRTHPDIDWDLAAREASRLGCLRTLRLALLLAEEMLAAAVPSEFTNAARADRGLVSQARWVQENIFREGVKCLGARFFAGTRDRLRDKLPTYGRELILRLTPNAHDRAVVRLPKHLGFAYYAIRPLRIIHKYSRRNRSDSR